MKKWRFGDVLERVAHIADGMIVMYVGPNSPHPFLDTQVVVLVPAPHGRQCGSVNRVASPLWRLRE